MSQECQQPQAHPARCGCEQKKPYPDRLCHIEHNVHPYRCGCLKGDAEAQRRFDAHQRNVSVPAPGVEMEVLPQHVMKLEAERLWGGDGEYAVSFEKAGWLQQCRQRGGTFLLYTAEAFKPIVTRLQAENSALQQSLNTADQRVDDLTTEVERQAAKFKEWQAGHHANYCKAADERDALKAEVEESNDRAFRASEAHVMTLGKLRAAESELTKARELMRSTSARLHSVHHRMDRLFELEPKYRVKLLTDALHTVVYAYKCIDNPTNPRQPLSKVFSLTKSIKWRSKRVSPPKMVTATYSLLRSSICS